jgi:hypothetical protein
MIFYPPAQAERVVMYRSSSGSIRLDSGRDWKNINKGKLDLITYANK